MSEPEPFPKQDKQLRLRGTLRPVTRINRRVLIAGAAAGMIGLFAAFSVALAPPKALTADTPAELAGTGNTRQPEGLSRLPASYDGLEIPRLGPPLAGDLGGTLVAEERAWGLEPDWDVPPSDDFRPSPEDEAERARRLASAKLADEASRSALFFAVADPRASSTPEVPAQLPKGPGAELMALAAGMASGAGAGPAGGDANLQERKSAFASSRPEAGTYNPYRVEAPISPYQVMAGTLLPAALLTAVQSDLPGTVIAQVTSPVHDTVTGRILLIPRGARLLGRYQSEISFGQDRALVVWDRILFPDGTSVRISEPGTDAAGAAGIAGRTDHHWDKVFAAAGLATLLGIGAEVGEEDEGDLERAVRRGFGDSVSRAGERAVDRGLSVQPTIRVEPGTPVRVLVTRDLVLVPYSDGAAP